jgi:tetratricopeptide (TPR) repeat protein
MDWLKEIRTFQRLDPKEVRLPVPERDASEAVARYNKAILNLQNDSADIAMIELKKVCATVPSFGQAFLLLGCCLMANGSPVAAERNFHKAESAVLPDSLLERPNLYAAAVSTQDPATQRDAFDEPVARVHAESFSEPLDARAMNHLVRPSRERRRKVKMAKTRERRNLLQGTEADTSPQDRASSRPALKSSGSSVTPVSANRFQGASKVLRPLAVLLLVAGLATGGILLYPTVSQALVRAFATPTGFLTPTPTPGADDRLAWILARIDDLRKSGKPVSAELRDLLEAFNAEFPDAAVSIPADPTVTPVPPTPSPSIPADSTLLQDAARDVSDAETRMAAKDSTGAADLLLLARTTLTALHAETSADGVAETAGQLLARATTLLDDVSRNACETWRLQGMALFDAKDFNGALVPFLKASAIDPGYYGGGLPYYIGRCYQLLSQPDLARPYYQYVVERFHGRDIANRAQTRLDQLG